MAVRARELVSAESQCISPHGTPRMYQHCKCHTISSGRPGNLIYGGCLHICNGVFPVRPLRIRQTAAALGSGRAASFASIRARYAPSMVTVVRADPAIASAPSGRSLTLQPSPAANEWPSQRMYFRLCLPPRRFLQCTLWIRLEHHSRER